MQDEEQGPFTIALYASTLKCDHGVLGGLVAELRAKVIAVSHGEVRG